VLRQLLRLTRPVPVAGETALAIAVYAGVDDTPIEARESGFEGVACVDDAARALEVACDVWTRTRLPWVERWARGLLAFVLWMQEEDGRWLNFVVDWNGAKNRSGITSVAGENFWHARATSSVERAWRTLGDPAAAESFGRGFAHALVKAAPPDVRALHMATALRDQRDGGDTRDALDRWCIELMSCRHGPVLMNSPYERGTPHLWAHIQEGVLAEAGALLGTRRYVDAAVRSGETLLLPVVGDGFELPTVTPYDVASVALSADGLAAATGDHRWLRVADSARAWFDGANPAGAAVYDRERGRVGDGVDGHKLNQNSGAEANIVAAQVLPEEAARAAASLDGDPLARALIPG
jgi:hypothetical protein